MKSETLMYRILDGNSSEEFLSVSNSLLSITQECRASMHEPDEQCVSADISDGTFNNAGAGGEMSIRLSDSSGAGVHVNLATLVALARVGAQELQRASNPKAKYDEFAPTEDELEKLKAVLKELEDDAYLSTGVKYETGGYATAEMFDYDEEYFDVEVKWGVQNDAKNTTNIEQYTVCREDFSVEDA